MSGKTGRRGHNEGSIYQRADGRWVGAVHLGWDATGRKRKVVYGKTRAEVNQKITRIRADHQKGLPIQTAGTTVAAFLQEWIDVVVRPNRTQGTTKQYQSMINTHLLDTIGKHKLEKLTQQHVQAMLNAKLAAGTSPAMVRQIRAVLRAALNQAMRWDLVGRNVAALTTPPKVERFEGYALSPDEVRAIMVQVQGDTLEPLYAIATSVGLRMAELLGLRWNDIDLDTCLIHVRRQLRVIDGTPILMDLKSRNSRRTVPLVGPVATIVRAHRKRQIAQRLEAGVPWSEDGHVFAWADGRPISDSHVRDHWHALRKPAGIPDHVRFHDLRHSALTILATRGTAPRTLMGIAGHSTIATTMGIYAHLDADDVRAAVDLMENLYSAEQRVK
jgi:integrase